MELIRSTQAHKTTKSRAKSLLDVIVKTKLLVKKPRKIMVMPQIKKLRVTLTLKICWEITKRKKLALKRKMKTF